jgi:hypothetical protein
MHGACQAPEPIGKRGFARSAQEKIGAAAGFAGSFLPARPRPSNGARSTCRFTSY